MVTITLTNQEAQALIHATRETRASLLNRKFVFKADHARATKDVRALGRAQDKLDAALEREGVR